MLWFCANKAVRLTVKQLTTKNFIGNSRSVDKQLGTVISLNFNMKTPHTASKTSVYLSIFNLILISNNLISSQG